MTTQRLNICLTSKKVKCYDMFEFSFRLQRALDIPRHCVVNTIWENVFCTGSIEQFYLTMVSKSMHMRYERPIRAQVLDREHLSSHSTSDGCTKRTHHNLFCREASVALTIMRADSRSGISTTGAISRTVSNDLASPAAHLHVCCQRRCELSGYPWSWLCS